MNVPPMAPAMARTEICSLTIAPSSRDRLLRGGFRTLRDLEGVQPSDLARGTIDGTTLAYTREHCPLAWIRSVPYHQPVASARDGIVGLCRCAGATHAAFLHISRRAAAINQVVRGICSSGVRSPCPAFLTVCILSGIPGFRRRPSPPPAPVRAR